MNTRHTFAAHVHQTRSTLSGSTHIVRQVGSEQQCTFHARHQPHYDLRFPVLFDRDGRAGFEPVIRAFNCSRSANWLPLGRAAWWIHC